MSEDPREGRAQAPLLLAEEVADALAERRPVVALESTLISHGLPHGRNLEVAREIEATVRAAGAVPASIALLDGRVRVGLDPAALERVADGAEVVKASIRDVPLVLATGRAGATTVASTAWLAHRVGIEVFATGGLGGVHRDAERSWDESADLPGLAVTPITVVCAGVKSILDVPATLERLETLSVSLVGYRTASFPGFYVRDSGLPVPWTLDSVEQIAAVMATRRALQARSALVVANPIPEASQLDRAWHDEILTAGLAELGARGVSGKDVTPFLLAWFHEQTGGASLAANIDLVLSNAALAARIAVAAAG